MRGRASGRGGRCGTPEAGDWAACLGGDAAKSKVSGAPDGGVGGSMAHEDGGANAGGGLGGAGARVRGRDAGLDATSGREVPSGGTADGEVDARGGVGAGGEAGATGPTTRPSG